MRLRAPPLCRRLQGQRDQATRAGDRELDLLTTLPLSQASTTRVARLDRPRWTLEPGFQPREAYFHSDIKTLGYPKAAWFGLCLALVASNMVAVVLAALRSVQGASRSAQALSLYAVAHDIAPTYPGMMRAIPEEEWRVFSRMAPAACVALLKLLAPQVRLAAYGKSPRGPQKPRPKRDGMTKTPHVSTAKLLREQQTRLMTR